MSDLKLMLDKTVETFENALLCLEKMIRNWRIKLLIAMMKSTRWRKIPSCAYHKTKRGQMHRRCRRIYLDLLSNLERIGDHSVNIAQYVIEDYLASIQDS